MDGQVVNVPEISSKFVLCVSCLQNQSWLSGLQRLLDHVLREI